MLRKQNPGRAWIGPIAVEAGRGATTVTQSTLIGTPAYVAGLDRDDEIVSFDGESVGSEQQLDAIVGRHKPGDRLRMAIRRRGTRQELIVTLQEDPRLELIPAENDGRRLTPAERTFRDAWLTSQQR